MVCGSQSAEEFPNGFVDDSVHQSSSLAKDHNTSQFSLMMSSSFFQLDADSTELPSLFSITVQMLCQNCSDLDLFGVFEGTHKGVPANLSTDWISPISAPESRWEWVENLGCDFCQFLRSTMTVADRRDRDCKPYCLQIWTEPGFTFNHEYMDANEVYPCVAIIPTRPALSPSMVDPPRSICFRPSQKGLPNDITCAEPTIRELPVFVEFGALKQWLQTCIQDHTCCRETNVASQRHLNRLRLIECSTRRVVSVANDVRYIALSYHWGGNCTGFSNPIDGRLPSALPLTIEDALATTLNLGFDYLWVDAYCIIQSDDTDFTHQIRQMDLIYRCAEVTIIAAAGSTSQSGLPGISKARECVQVRGNFAHLPLLTFPPSAWLCVAKSPWFSRGWTFQELFFSRRRLFFTHNEVIFDCYEGSMTESIFCRQEVRNDLPRWRKDLPQVQIYDLIERYSLRHLTFRTDILRAFEGILREFDSQNPAVKSVWGIPLLHDVSGYLVSFLSGLCWTRLAPPLPEYRRKDFPSWAWTGWMGPITYTQSNLAVSARIPGEFSVNFGIEGASHLTWSDFEAQLFCQGKDWISPKQLILTAPSYEMIVQRSSLYPYMDRLALPYYHFVADFDSTISSRLVVLNVPFEDLEPTTPPSPHERTCFAIHLLSGAFDHPKSMEIDILALLLVTRKHDYWERVGFTFFDNSTPHSYRPDFEYLLEKQPSFQVREFIIV